MKISSPKFKRYDCVYFGSVDEQLSVIVGWIFLRCLFQLGRRWRGLLFVLCGCWMNAVSASRDLVIMAISVQVKIPIYVLQGHTMIRGSLWALIASMQCLYLILCNSSQCLYSIYIYIYIVQY